MPLRYRDDDADDTPPPPGRRARGGFGGRPGRGWRTFFRAGDNVFTWSLPLGRYFGIEVRLSILFALYLLFEVIDAAFKNALQMRALMLGSLLVLVLLHEFGHCFACRRVGGEADEILLWPLGGLAYCRPPHNWRADLITTLGGPAVNLALAPVLGGAIALTGGGWEALIFNPFNYAAAWSGYAHSVWQSALWAAYFTNAVLLAFNVLVPAFPLDGGRIVQALLWRRTGYAASMDVATRIGLVGSVGLGLAGMVAESYNLIGIALFTGITCVMARQRLRFAPGQGRGGEEESPYAESLRSEPDADEARAQAARRARAQEQATEAAEVDRLLAKIAAGGMQSLSAREARFLRQATDRRRHS